MFTQSAEIYDAIHESLHDYAAATDRLLELIRRHVPSLRASLLDVACGTGAYLVRLKDYLRVEGVDLNPAMLGIATAKAPDVPLHLGDMIDFDLDREFDAVICLGSSIGYILTVPRLNETVRNLAHHARPEGIVVVEPWITPDAWEAGRIRVLCVDEPNRKIARMTVSDRHESVSGMDFQYLIGSDAGVDYFEERHELGLFTHDDYVNAFQEADLAVSYDPVGLLGRGLYVGVRSSE